MKKSTRAVFIDRDGVINEPMGGREYVPDWESFRFREGVLGALKKLSEAGFVIVVVSNQSCVAKGLVPKEKVEEIHAKMAEAAAAAGARIDAVYYCPHNTAENCDCKKPKTGMFTSAIKKFGIDPKRSFTVGDSARDLEAGHAVGTTNFWVSTGEEKTAPPALYDREVRGLGEAADAILSWH
jgi:D-glycero-D-manno-heptose 1,7-bisphosphate phosphatase